VLQGELGHGPQRSLQAQDFGEPAQSCLRITETRVSNGYPFNNSPDLFGPAFTPQTCHCLDDQCIHYLREAQYQPARVRPLRLRSAVGSRLRSVMDVSANWQSWSDGFVARGNRLRFLSLSTDVFTNPVMVGAVRLMKRMPHTSIRRSVARRGQLSGAQERVRISVLTQFHTRRSRMSVRVSRSILSEPG